MADPEFISGLVANPRESLAVELKAWFDPATREGQAKIIRCTLAMRNHGGGYMAIGFDDATGQPLVDAAPDNVREAFHVDKIQGLVTRFSSEAFEVEVHFCARHGAEFPVIAVPAGVKTPVVTKSALTGDKGSQPLVRDNKVFVRTLGSNNTPSTSEAGWQDWSPLLETCFENREADIGRFVRRHLTAISSESVQHIANAFAQATAKPETTEEKMRSLMDAGFAKFGAAQADRFEKLPPHGSWEVAVKVNGEIPKPASSSDFISRLLSSNPNYAGWPVWVDSRSFSDVDDRPYPNEGAWEAMIVALEGLNHIDFWRLSPSGEFYLYQAFKDDLRSPRQQPMSVLDFTLPILRVADAIAVSMAFAKALGCPEESTTISIGFRWRGLKGRVLDAWGSPGRDIRPGRPAKQDEVISTLTLGLDTPQSSIPVFVQAALSPLFEVFDGREFGPALYEGITRRLLERQTL